jgi:uncharacterized cupin superfamily protein
VRKTFALLFLFLFCAIGTLAQSTTVSGTITDLGGQAWNNGSYQIAFYTNGTIGPYFQSGTPFNPNTSFSGFMNSSGAFSLSVPSNTSITPANTLWRFTVCPAASANCFSTNISVTGASMNVSGLIVPPAIQVSASAFNQPTAYSDSEIVGPVIGFTYYNLTDSKNHTCTGSIPPGCTWIAGGGGSGSLPAGSQYDVQTNGGSGLFNSGVSGPANIGVQGNISVKPSSSNNVQYVASTGNDTNDGFSMGTAKLTWDAACAALPGGSSVGLLTCGSGVIHVMGSVAANSSGTYGRWLMGSTDPNYSSPPAGWYRYSGALKTDCVTGPIGYGASGSNTICFVTGGSTSSPGFPGLWLSGINGGFEDDHIAIQNYVLSPVRIGIDSNGNRNGTAGGGVNGIRLIGLESTLGNCSLGGGPSVDIGSNSFEIYLDHPDVAGCIAEDYTIVASTGIVRSSGTVTATTTATNDVAVGQIVTINNVTDPSFNGSFKVTAVAGTPQTQISWAQTGPNTTSGGGYLFNSAQASAIAVNPGTGTGSGLVKIVQPLFQDGGLFCLEGTNGGGCYLSDAEEEGNPTSGPTPPMVIVPKADGNLVGRFSNLEISDFNNPVATFCTVEVDSLGGVVAAAYNILSDRVAGLVCGPMNIQAGGYGPGTQTVPEKQGEVGTFLNHLVGQTDVARRQFSPTAVRFTNLANTNPATWNCNGCGSGTITTGITAPDGTTGAARISSSGGAVGLLFPIASQTFAAGDIIEIGVWARSEGTTGGFAGGAPLQFSLPGTSGYVITELNGAIPGTTQIPTYIQGDCTGASPPCEWEWYSKAYKITVVGTANPTTPQLNGVANLGYPASYYGPVFLHIATGTVDDNEAALIASDLESYGSNAPVGSVAGLPGQELAVPGSTQFYGLFAHANTANRTYTFPNIAGMVGIISSATPINNDCANFSVVGTVVSIADSGVLCGTSGGGANTSLSNLATTSINQALLPSSAGGQNLGSSSLPWGTIYGNTLQIGNTTSGGTLDVGTAGGSTAGLLRIHGSTATNNTGPGCIGLFTSPSDALADYLCPSAEGGVFYSIGSPATVDSTNILSPVGIPNPQSGTTYTILTSDRGNTVYLTSSASAASTWTMPLASNAQGASFPPGFKFRAANQNLTYAITFNATSPNTFINSSGTPSSITIAPNSAVDIQVDQNANLVATSAGGVGSGTVTSFSVSGSPCLSPLFTCSVATPTTTPALSFTLSNAAQGSVFAGPPSGGPGAPTFQTAPSISAANMTNFPSSLAIWPSTVGIPRWTGGVAWANSINDTSALTGQYLAANNGGSSAFISPGLGDGNGGAPVAASYTAQCDSSTSILDRGTTLRLQSGGTPFTVPLSTASGCGGHFYFAILDDGAGTVTVNRTSPDTFSIFNGLTNTDGATSFTLTNGQTAVLNQGATGIWEVRINQLANLGTPTTLTLTNATGLPFGSLVSFPTLCSGSQFSQGPSAASNNCAPAIIPVGTVSSVTGQSTSQSAVTLATAPSAGAYVLRYYADLNTPCTTGANSVSFTFNWTDAGASRSLQTGSLSMGTAQLGSSYLSGTFPLYVNSGNVTYTSTVSGTCATGTSSYDIHASLTN